MFKFLLRTDAGGERLGEFRANGVAKSLAQPVDGDAQGVFREPQGGGGLQLLTVAGSTGQPRAQGREKGRLPSACIAVSRAVRERSSTVMAH